MVSGRRVKRKRRPAALGAIVALLAGCPLGAPTREISPPSHEDASPERDADADAHSDSTDDFDDRQAAADAEVPDIGPDTGPYLDRGVPEDAPPADAGFAARGATCGVNQPCEGALECVDGRCCDSCGECQVCDARGLCAEAPVGTACGPLRCSIRAAALFTSSSSVTCVAWQDDAWGACQQGGTCRPATLSDCGGATRVVHTCDVRCRQPHPSGCITGRRLTEIPFESVCVANFPSRDCTGPVCVTRGGVSAQGQLGCDALGECVATNLEGCGPYACEANDVECEEDCMTNAECAAGFSCVTSGMDMVCQ